MKGQIGFSVFLYEQFAQTGRRQTPDQPLWDRPSIGLSRFAQIARIPETQPTCICHLVAPFPLNFLSGMKDRKNVAKDLQADLSSHG